MVSLNKIPQGYIVSTKNPNIVGLSPARSSPTKHHKGGLSPFPIILSLSHNKALLRTFLSVVINAIITRYFSAGFKFYSRHIRDIINIFQSIQEEGVTKRLPKLVKSNNQQQIGRLTRFYLSISSYHQYLTYWWPQKSCDHIFFSKAPYSKIQSDCWVPRTPMYQVVKRICVPLGYKGLNHLHHLINIRNTNKSKVI